MIITSTTVTRGTTRFNKDSCRL